MRLGRREPPLGGAADRRRQPDHARAELDLVAGLDVLARLGGLAVDLHAPAADRVDGQRARLHEPRGPQPLVDPDRLDSSPTLNPTLGAGARCWSHEETDRVTRARGRGARPRRRIGQVAGQGVSRHVLVRRRRRRLRDRQVRQGTPRRRPARLAQRARAAAGAAHEVRVPAAVRARPARRTRPAAPNVAGWNYRRGGVLKTNRKGVANGSAKARHFRVDPAKDYAVVVYEKLSSGQLGPVVLCAVLHTKSKATSKPHDKPKPKPTTSRSRRSRRRSRTARATTPRVTTRRRAKSARPATGRTRSKPKGKKSRR